MPVIGIHTLYEKGRIVGYLIISPYLHDGLVVWTYKCHKQLLLVQVVWKN